MRSVTAVILSETKNLNIQILHFVQDDSNQKNSVCFVIFGVPLISVQRISVIRKNGAIDGFRTPRATRDFKNPRGLRNCTYIYKMGRSTGFEPATTRTTTESSTAELRPPQLTITFMMKNQPLVKRKKKGKR